MKKSSFFAMISRMKYINRWGLMRNTRPENLSEHSLDTAVIAHALALIGNRRLGQSYNPERAALLCIYHDTSEIITGDLPTPVKYHSDEIRYAYRDVERLAQNSLLAMLPEELRPEYREIMIYGGPEDGKLKQLVKAADKISAVIKCIEEKKSGNTEFETAEQTLRGTICDMSLAEADIFMEEFLPAYLLTLDEQK